MNTNLDAATDQDALPDPSEFIRVYPWLKTQNHLRALRAFAAILIVWQAARYFSSTDQ